MKPAIMRALLAATILLLCVSSVWAQSIPVPSINLSGTITSTNTFQSIQAQTNNRNGCTIENPGTNTNNEYVYFGPIASATESASALLQPGQSVNCVVASNIVLKDQVSITGTATNAFFANFQ